MDTIEQIKQNIHAKFPLLDIYVFYYANGNELEIQITNKDVYYSDEYQEIVTQINLELLWPKNIMNVLFVLR